MEANVKKSSKSSRHHSASPALMQNGIPTFMQLGIKELSTSRSKCHPMEIGTLMEANR